MAETDEEAAPRSGSTADILWHHHTRLTCVVVGGDLTETDLPGPLGGPGFELLVSHFLGWLPADGSCRGLAGIRLLSDGPSSMLSSSSVGKTTCKSIDSFSQVAGYRTSAILACQLQFGCMAIKGGQKRVGPGRTLGEQLCGY